MIRQIKKDRKIQQERERQKKHHPSQTLIKCLGHILDPDKQADEHTRRHSKDECG